MRSGCTENCPSEQLLIKNLGLRWGQCAQWEEIATFNQFFHSNGGAEDIFEHVGADIYIYIYIYTPGGRIRLHIFR